MILLFDAESSGLVRKELPPLDPSQPHLVQIAAKLVDEQGRRIMRWTAVVRPDNWSIEPEAEAIHGISERRAYRVGVPLVDALRPLRVMAPLAKVIVGHGIQNFDRQLITAELHRLKAKADWWNGRGADFFDCAEEATEICKLAGEYGSKFPSLKEALDFFFPEGAPHITTHDAENDLEDTQRLYFAILERQTALASVPRRA